MSAPAPPPDWSELGRTWPNRRHSAFVAAGGLDWHIQRMGGGPPLLLLHGTGAATHSWRDLMPRLARRFAVLAPDLPGHGFSGTPRASLLSLPGMAKQVAALLERLGVRPEIVVGHSAGAAIAAQLVLEGRIAPRTLLSLNGALLPPPGVQAAVFPWAARLVSGLPLLPGLVARTASDRRIDALLADTGSTLDPVGRRCYAALFRRPAHVSGAFAMMAHWDLRPLQPSLPRLGARLLLAAGDADRMIPASAAVALHGRIPGARLQLLPGLGHLMHEEAPGRVTALLDDAEAG